MTRFLISLINSYLLLSGRLGGSTGGRCRHVFLQGRHIWTTFSSFPCLIFFIMSPINSLFKEFYLVSSFQLPIPHLCLVVRPQIAHELIAIVRLEHSDCRVVQGVLHELLNEIRDSSIPYSSPTTRSHCTARCLRSERGRSGLEPAIINIIMYPCHTQLQLGQTKRKKENIRGNIVFCSFRFCC